MEALIEENEDLKNSNFELTLENELLKKQIMILKEAEVLYEKQLQIIEGKMHTGFYWRQMMTDTGVEPDAWGYLIVCVPIVVIFAPLGSILSSHFHRQVLAFLVYILDTVALITALIVIPVTLSLGIMW